MELKNSIVLTLLLSIASSSFITAMEVNEAKQEQKSRLERAKEFIRKNPKAVIAIAATTLIVAGGIGLSAHRLKTGRWIWAKEIQAAKLTENDRRDYLAALGLKMKPNDIRASIQDILKKNPEAIVPKNMFPRALSNEYKPITFAELLEIEKKAYAFKKTLETVGGLLSYKIKIIDYLNQDPVKIEEAKKSIKEAISKGEKELNIASVNEYINDVQVMISAVEEANTIK